MKRPIWQLAGLVLAVSLPAASAFAQLEGMLGKAGKHPDLKGMAGMASSPMASGSMGNVAGLLKYCVGNGQLSQQTAAPVQDQLERKLPETAKSDDKGYSDGLKGLLHGSNGNTLDLGSGGGLTADITKKACDTVLGQAKSFL